MKAVKYTATLLIATLVLALSGCVRADDVHIGGLEDIALSLQSGGLRADAMVRVENASGKNIRIENVKLTLTDAKGNPLADMIVRDRVLIPKRSNSVVTIPAYIKLSNPLASLSTLRAISRNPDKIFVNGSASIKAGMMSKKIKIKDMTLREFISAFDPDVQKYLNQLKNI